MNRGIATKTFLQIPQALFQSHRLRSIVIAAAATFCARNPYRYNLDIYYGCRFYYWLVNTAYAVGEFFYHKQKEITHSLQEYLIHFRSFWLF